MHHNSILKRNRLLIFCPTVTDFILNLLFITSQALGCILYTMCFLLHPFQDAGSLGILSAKIKFPEAPIAPEVKLVLMRMLDVRQLVVKSEKLQYCSTLIYSITSSTALTYHLQSPQMPSDDKFFFNDLTGRS
jgi:hypothetical protein